MSKRYHFLQHIPNFVSGCDPVEFDFDTIDELLGHEIISHYREYDDFHRFSIALNKYCRHPVLMHEYNGGEGFWVLGHISYKESGKDVKESEIVNQLPIWELPENLK